MARPKSKNPWTLNEREILGGKSIIFTTQNSGGNFYIRMKIPNEGKYLKRSLKTRDLETAISLAEEITVNTLADIKVGRKVFSITLGELVNQYLDYRRGDIYIADQSIEFEGITEGRWNTQKSQLNNFLKVKSAKLKLSELDAHSCYEYFKLRREISPNVTVSTIRNEQSTINAMMKWAYLNRIHTAFEKFVFREINTKGVNRDSRRRDTFEENEYRTLVKAMRRWIKKYEKVGGKDYYDRQLVQLCILIGANTLLRTGELWKLKWGDIKGLKKTTTEKGLEIILVNLIVRAENAKTRQRREVTGRGGEYFKRLKRISNFTDKESFVFSDYENDRRFPRERLYDLWGELMNFAGFRNYSERKLTWYSLRHFGITQRLKAEVEISTIAKIAGTSVVQIERHYGHYDSKMKERAMTKDATYLPKYDDIDEEL